MLQREFPSTHITANNQLHPSVPADSWVLLNGSPPWVASILPVYASSCRCLVGLTASPIPRDFPWETHSVSSVCAGSVVSHKWLFFSIPSVAPPLAPDMYDVISESPEGPPPPVLDSRESYAREPPMQSLSPEENEVWLQQYTKSVKADDTATPVHLWDERVWRGKSHLGSVLAFKGSFNKCPLSSLWLFLLRRWKINV
jgi:hypothetical protein